LDPGGLPGSKIDPFFSRTPAQIAASARHPLLDRKFDGLSGVLFRHIKQFKAQKAGPAHL
jgi:hypothetical protein